ncbi:hypothetical protein CKA32_006469 [Geitlerinema sp. FC II]|nr:hypothetical protein CKA32_006469 [Geitlerinema sp. FC II]
MEVSKNWTFKKTNQFSVVVIQHKNLTISFKKTKISIIIKS